MSISEGLSASAYPSLVRLPRRQARSLGNPKASSMIPLEVIFGEIKLERIRKLGPSTFIKSHVAYEVLHGCGECCLEPSLNLRCHRVIICVMADCTYWLTALVMAGAERPRPSAGRCGATLFTMFLPTPRAWSPEPVAAFPNGSGSAACRRSSGSRYVPPLRPWIFRSPRLTQCSPRRSCPFSPSCQLPSSAATWCVRPAPAAPAPILNFTPLPRAPREPSGSS